MNTDGTSAEFYGPEPMPLATRTTLVLAALLGLAAVVAAVVEACR